jgi:hypothetical protein
MLFSPMNRQSAVSIATVYGPDDRASVTSRIPSSSRRLYRFRGTPSLIYNGVRGIKLPGHETEHLPPTSAKIKKMRIYTSTHLCDFVAWCLRREAQGLLFLLYVFAPILIKEFVKSTGTKFRPPVYINSIRKELVVT